MRTNILTIGFADEFTFNEFINNFKARQNEGRNETMKQVKILEFEIDEEDKNDFLQWLANYCWISDNPNFSKVKEQIINATTGFTPIKTPENRLNVKNRMMIYFVAERQLKK